MNGKDVYSTAMPMPKFCIALSKSIIAFLLFGFLFTSTASAQVKVYEGGNVGVKTNPNITPSEALEVNGTLRVNQFNTGTEMLVGQDDEGVLTNLGLGIGLLFDGNGNLAIDPDQLGGDGWSLEGNDGITDDNFIGTLNDKPLRFVVAENEVLKIEANGSIIPKSLNFSNEFSNTCISIGSESGSLDMGLSNILVGNNSGENLNMTGPEVNKSADRNIYIGQNTGSTGGNTGSNNIFLGHDSGERNRMGYNNFFAGNSAGDSNIDGYNNVFIGNLAGDANTQGKNNVYIGAEAGSEGFFGQGNVKIGKNSGKGATSNFNVIIGESAGETYGNVPTSVLIGYKAGDVELTTTGGLQSYGNMAIGGFSTFSSDQEENSKINSVVLGYQAIVNASNKIRLGNTNITIVESQVGMWETSDQRFKYEIEDNIPGLDFITRLRPVSYKFDTEEFDLHLMQGMDESKKAERTAGVDYSESKNMIRTGFLAQEVEQVCSELNYNFGGVHVPSPDNPTDNYSLSYSKFVVPLVQAVKEQQVIIEELQSQKESQDQLISDLIKRIEALESK